MNKNLKYVFLLATIIFLLISITAISAENTINKDITDKTTSDVSATKVAETKEVEKATKNIVKKENSTSTENEGKTHVVTDNNVDTIFSGTGNTLGETVLNGDTLDFQGTIDKNHSLVINKPINVISSTKDAVINLHTVAGTLFGEDPGNCFIVNNGGSNSYVSGLYLNNTECWVYNTNNVTYYNMTMHVENARVGSGVGQTSIRFSNNITMDNCHIYTENNGGSSSFVINYGCNNVTIKNSLVEGVGQVGNIIYLGNPFNLNDKPEGYDLPTLGNAVINCTIKGGTGGSSNALQYGALHALIQGNKFYSKGGVGPGAYGTTPGYATYIDNEIYDSASFTIVENSTAYGNIIYGTGSTTIAKNSQVYNNTFKKVTVSAANTTFENNTATDLTVSQPINLKNNDLNTVLVDTNAKDSNITDNNISGGIQVAAANVTIKNNNIVCKLNETPVTITGATCTVEDNMIYGLVTTGDAAVKAPETATVQNNQPVMLDGKVISDVTYSQFFDEDGNVKTDILPDYSQAILVGSFNNKSFKINGVSITIKGDNCIINNGAIIVGETGKIVLSDVDFNNDQSIETALQLNSAKNIIRNVKITKNMNTTAKAREIVIKGDENKVNNTIINITGPSSPTNYDETPSLSPIIGILVMSSSNVISNNTVNYKDTNSDFGFRSTDLITITGVLGEINKNIVTQNRLNAEGTGYIYGINVGVNSNNNTESYNNITITSTHYAYGVQMLQAPVYNNRIERNNITLNAGTTAYGIFSNPWSEGNNTFGAIHTTYNVIRVNAPVAYGIQFTGSPYGITLEGFNATYTNFTINGTYAMGIGISNAYNVYFFRNTYNITGTTNETDSTSLDYVKPTTAAIYIENVDYIRSATEQGSNVTNGPNIIYNNVTNGTVTSATSINSDNTNIILINTEKTNITSNTINSANTGGICLINSSNNRIQSNTFNTNSDLLGDDQVVTDENSNNNTISSNSPPYNTVVTFVKTTAKMDEILNITVNVARSDNRNPVPNGTVEFTDEAGEVLATATVTDGKATFEYGIIESYDEIIINAQYQASKYFESSRVVKTNISVLRTTIIDPIKKTTVLGDTTELVAHFYDENGVGLNEGQVIFRVNGKTLRDEEGNVIYATIVDGEAKLDNVTITSDWMRPDTTIQAVYTGSANVDPIFTKPRAVNITKPEANIEITPIAEAKAGDTITLTATVTNNGENINTGRVAFKLNGKTLKDEDGKALYATVVNGIATVQYTIPAKTKANEYTLTAVFSDANYDRSEDNKSLIISK